MSIYKLVFIIICHLSFVASAQSDPDSTFTKANEAYADENYMEALRLYKSIEKKGLTSSELFFNMGNAAYKLENTAESIYYFEKALKLSPEDEAIKNNLAYAERMRLDQFEVVPSSDLDKSYKSFLMLFSMDGWAVMALVLLGVALVSFGFFVFKGKTSQKRLFFILFIVFLIVSTVSYLIANKQQKLIEDSTYLIIFQEEINLLEAPNPNATILLQLHEGTKVKLLDEFRSFKQIELPNGTKGWLEEGNLKRI